MSEEMERILLKNWESEKRMWELSEAEYLKRLAHYRDARDEARATLAEREEQWNKKEFRLGEEIVNLHAALGEREAEIGRLKAAAPTEWAYGQACLTIEKVKLERDEARAAFATSKNSREELENRLICVCVTLGLPESTSGTGLSNAIGRNAADARKEALEEAAQICWDEEATSCVERIRALASNAGRGG